MNNNDKDFNTLTENQKIKLQSYDASKLFFRGDNNY